jgi:hypothetical protein
MAVAIPFIMVGMAVLGTVMSAQAQREQGEAAKEAADYNAGIARRNAQISLDQADMDAEAQQRDAPRHMGAMRADYGAAGITISPGRVGGHRHHGGARLPEHPLQRQNSCPRVRGRSGPVRDERRERGVVRQQPRGRNADWRARQCCELRLRPRHVQGTPAAGYSGGRATNSLTGLRVGGV